MKDKQDDLSLFFSELGSAGQIKSADARGVDEKLERDMISKTSLHKYEHCLTQMVLTLMI